MARRDRHRRRSLAVAPPRQSAAAPARYTLQGALAGAAARRAAEAAREARPRDALRRARRGEAGTRFRLWAPACARWASCSTRARARCRCARCRTAGTSSWSRMPRPAPATRSPSTTGARCPTRLSRANPDDVHGPSVVVDPRRVRLARRRLARPAVARGGALRAAPRHLHARGHLRARRAARLDDLAALGVTALELMPVADFPGTAQLGLRRRAAVRARRRLRHARRAQALRGRGARARA